MDYRIRGRVALVVGGSRGIGKDAARMLAAEGSSVAIVARTRKHIDRAVAEITEAGGEAVGVSSDMTSKEGIETAVATVTEQLGTPLIVVTQADFHTRGFFEEVTHAEDYVDSYRAYTLSQVYMLRAVLPAMREAGWGRFVHIGSATAKEPQSLPPHTVANATRPATVGLLKSVADEYAQFGITINTVAPGWIATKTTNWYLSTHEGLADEAARKKWLIEKAGVPAGRAGEPEEIASTIAYLCSDQAGYLNGHYICVDGAHHRSAF
ncbi:SDR family oxidoreductase [Nocardia nova]|uniref:SDR family oxidoreductase n=1 Tax=Nocardia nova TaxID=37330 RepID=UPI0025AEDE73|nr:SDR family oxidoreductase [Nocardia nova]MDN2496877.1 SDR family oxidoreductase [Nocardia nova]